MNARTHEASKRRRRASILLAWLAVAATIPLYGCRRSDDLGPPAVAYGQTECDLCKMIISEEPFAAAAVVVEADEVTKLAFDDIGCLLDFLHNEGPSACVVAYVHDYQSQRWLDAATAVFVRSETIQTPMASHLAACETQEAAADLLRRYPGTSTAFVQLKIGAAPKPGSDALTQEWSNP